MGIFSRIFGANNSNIPQPDIKFGRFSDAYKSEKQHEIWEEAMDLFEKEDYLNSYIAFFKYLNNEAHNSVTYNVTDGKIDFEILQGSKKLHGTADRKKLKAGAKIAKTESLNIGFLRRLIEKNYELQYSRYALDNEDDIAIVFDTFVLDGSPFKVYYALKEMALNADKQDDLLLNEFEMLKPVDVSLLHHIPEDIKEIKYEYFINEIKRTIEFVEKKKFDSGKFSGGITYLLLDLVYSLDYLIKPEGYTMEAFERIHRLYFANDGKTTSQKNATLIKEFKKLLERSKEKYFEEMYSVVCTFGITVSAGHDKVVNIINSELSRMDWYMENDHDIFALAIPNYIVGYSLFNFALPEPVRDLFHLYYQIVEIDYFKKLGFKLDYFDFETKKINHKAIKKEINAIEKRYSKKFPKLKINADTLKFSSFLEFVKSYLLMVRDMKVG